ncbi:MAG: hypothetical protein MJ072_06395 [Clostridia bacterium]|nr:hypothetical protein [Clostridia bacterium]
MKKNNRFKSLFEDITEIEIMTPVVIVSVIAAIATGLWWVTVIAVVAFALVVSFGMTKRMKTIEKLKNYCDGYDKDVALFDLEDYAYALNGKTMSGDGKEVSVEFESVLLCVKRPRFKTVFYESIRSFTVDGRGAIRITVFNEDGDSVTAEFSFKRFDEAKEFCEILKNVIALNKKEKN